MKFINLFYVAFYLSIAVMTEFDIMEVSKVLHILMALSLALLFIKEFLEAEE